jgi:hypothetical protein
LLINFHVVLIKDGIARVVNGLEEDIHAKSPSRKDAQGSRATLSLGFQGRSPWLCLGLLVVAPAEIFSARRSRKSTRLWSRSTRPAWSMASNVCGMTPRSAATTEHGDVPCLLHWDKAPNLNENSTLNSMRLALLQINPTAGDLEGNSSLIVRGARAAEVQGADLMVTPELALMGYHEDPIEALAKAGARAIVNLSASPFTVGKKP